MKIYFAKEFYELLMNQDLIFNIRDGVIGIDLHQFFMKCKKDVDLKTLFYSTIEFLNEEQTKTKSTYGVNASNSMLVIDFTKPSETRIYNHTMNKKLFKIETFVSSEQRIFSDISIHCKYELESKQAYVLIYTGKLKEFNETGFVTVGIED